MQTEQVGTIHYSYINKIINNDTNTTLSIFSRTELEVLYRRSFKWTSLAEIFESISGLCGKH